MLLFSTQTDGKLQIKISYPRKDSLVFSCVLSLFLMAVYPSSWSDDSIERRESQGERGGDDMRPLAEIKPGTSQWHDAYLNHSNTRASRVRPLQLHVSELVLVFSSSFETFGSRCDSLCDLRPPSPVFVPYLRAFSSFWNHSFFKAVSLVAAKTLLTPPVRSAEVRRSNAPSCTGPAVRWRWRCAEFTAHSWHQVSQNYRLFF